MQLIKCDICKREIKNDDKSLDIRLGFKHHELCENCSLPIIKFLTKNQLIKNKKLN